LEKCSIGEWCNLVSRLQKSNWKNNYGSGVFGDYLRINWDTGPTVLWIGHGDHSKSGQYNVQYRNWWLAVWPNVLAAASFENTSKFSWGGSEGLKLSDWKKQFEVRPKRIDGAQEDQPRWKQINPFLTAILIRPLNIEINELTRIARCWNWQQPLNNRHPWIKIGIDERIALPIWLKKRREDKMKE